MYSDIKAHHPKFTVAALLTPVSTMPYAQVSNDLSVTQAISALGEQAKTKAEAKF